MSSQGRSTVEPAYPAARAVASLIQPLFEGRGTAPTPDVEAIEAIVNAAFWASLRRIEGYVPTISLAYVPPEQAVQPLMLDRPLALEAEALARLAPAVERAGIHLGAWRDQGEMKVWGTTRSLPGYCFVLEVIAPGLLVIKRPGRQDSSKYINVAVLEGNQIKIVKQSAEGLGSSPALLGSLLRTDTPERDGEPVNALVELAVSMRAHRRGGSLLVVRAGTEAWRDSILWPAPYLVRPPFPELADLMRDGPRDGKQRRWEEALRRAVDAIAGLTAVDGATVIDDRYDLLAFGAKIGRRQGSARVERVMVTEQIEGSDCEVMNAAQLGGTRHLSAAQFAQDQTDTLSLVASQDGRFTVFAWSDAEQMVHGHRVEALLL